MRLFGLLICLVALTQCAPSDAPADDEQARRAAMGAAETDLILAELRYDLEVSEDARFRNVRRVAVASPSGRASAIEAYCGQIEMEDGWRDFVGRTIVSDDGVGREGYREYCAPGRGTPVNLMSATRAQTAGPMQSQQAFLAAILGAAALLLWLVVRRGSPIGLAFAGLGGQRTRALPAPKGAIPVRQRSDRTKAAAVPDGERIYAIGDVHGRLDLLVLLITRIEQDNRTRGVAKTTVILLGDLVDRGPNSAECLEFLSHLRPAFARFEFIMGNHEEVMLKVLTGVYDLQDSRWLTFGGRKTLASYGVPADVMQMSGPAFTSAVASYVPREHVAFLREFRDCIRHGDYVFAHAGVRPGVALEDQDGNDLRWIGRDFLESRADHGCVVVHGHSIVPAPEFRENRVAIDTGAYKSGTLTAIGLERTEQWVIST